MNICHSWDEENVKNANIEDNQWSLVEQSQIKLME